MLLMTTDYKHLFDAHGYSEDSLSQEPVIMVCGVCKNQGITVTQGMGPEGNLKRVIIHRPMAIC